MADKPRILQDSRDLIWSLLPLVLIALVIAGIAGSCSWGFGDKAAQESIPSFDVRDGLKADAASMPFAVRHPAVPTSWKPNSGSTQEVGSTVSSNVGWIADSGAYVQLTQTDATEEQLVMKLAGSEAAGEGVETIRGLRWVKYRGEDDKVWIADMGDARVAVKTRGGADLLTTLATAVTEASPISAERPKPADGPAPSPTP
ncbi:DUF4245 domain-containing protein [Gordonia shandongensis]|uniref:DUF4245 domain-containing protein n=1 Tax=Gordonia shandongensis TaxID=376351 RepID=UPI000400B858|nr:DUF4245 domain-containing protein [Gordonia shandongensis]